MKRVEGTNYIHYIASEYHTGDPREYKEHDEMYFARALYEPGTDNIIGVGLFYQDGEEFLPEMEERQYVLVTLQMEREKWEKEYDDYLMADPVLKKLNLNMECARRLFEEMDYEQRGRAMADYENDGITHSDIGISVQNYKDINFSDSEAIDYAIETDTELLKLDKAKFRKKVRAHPDMKRRLDVGETHDIEDMPAHLMGRQRAVMRMGVARDKLLEKEYERTGKLRRYHMNGTQKTFTEETEIDLEF